MKIVFLTISCIKDISNRGIYNDLMRKFRNEGHELCVVSPRPRFMQEDTNIVCDNGVSYLGVKTWNVTKSKSIIEKGIGQLLIEDQFIRALKKYVDTSDIDLVLYSTPPVTFSKVIGFLKRVSPKAKTYLLLKDIFPQNAVDIGMMSKNGLKSIIYKVFRNKERKLYALSDFIGCMSPANVEYLLKHNPEVSAERVEVAPNSVEPKNDFVEKGESLELKAKTERCFIRTKYNLPIDRPIFIYGGNLGKPQGIPFLIDCLDANRSRDDCHFVIVGSGTERPKIESWFNTRNPKSVTLLNKLPKDEYDMLVRSCDVGLIFLDYRFTIPNYPSRLLSYMENRMPIVAATDYVSDIGKIAEENGYGYWCHSNSVSDFTTLIDRMVNSNRLEMGEKGYKFFTDHYLVDRTYSIIMSHL